MWGILKNKRVVSWAVYDWANSAFATTVLAGFFPIFFKQYWDQAADSTVSTFHLGVGNSVASVIIVMLAPLLGAIADRGLLRKHFLLVFASLGVLSTAGLFWIGQGMWLPAVMCFSAGLVGFMGANIFYDALIVSVVEPEKRDFVSSFGYALGYLGGGVLFSVNVAMTLTPEFFGIDNAAQAVRISFLSVALWWAIFSIPLILYVKDSGTAIAGRYNNASVLRAGFVQLLNTIRTLRSYRKTMIFLFAYWFYIDGVDTIVRMAVDYGLSLGLAQNDLIIALLISQFVGFPATLGFGYIGQHFGNRIGIYIGLLCYILVTVWAYFISQAWEFYVLAVAVGLVQGGVQSLSRSYYASLIPIDRQGEFFGFYNMMGKSAAILGPLIVGGVSVLTQSHRIGMLSVIILFVIGGVLFYFVNHKQDSYNTL